MRGGKREKGDLKVGGNVFVDIVTVPIAVCIFVT